MSGKWRTCRSAPSNSDAYSDSLANTHYFTAANNIANTNSLAKSNDFSKAHNFTNANCLSSNITIANNFSVANDFSAANSFTNRFAFSYFNTDNWSIKTKSNTNDNRCIRSI